MNASIHQQVSKNEQATESFSGADGNATDTSVHKTEDTDLLNRSAFRRDSGSRSTTKKVKIVDPKQNVEADSDDEDLLSQPNIAGVPVIGESIGVVNCGQPNDQQASATSADRKKTKEERKKEREKKKEEEMLKKYQAEQEAKQKVSAKSKCSRWIKHNLKIGEGGYKFVYRGYDSVEARNVAWCEFKREHVDTKEKRQAMFRETEIMLKMNHPHIVRCFDVFREWIDMEDPNNQIEEKGVVIIQELMGEGTLKSVIRKNFLDGQCILKFPLITRWWHQILDALRYMHHKIQPPILHRDLKADNCFLYGASDEEYLNVKVGDFGLATHVSNSGRKTMLGTLGFMAPEIFDEKYDEKVDIYAFGMLMLEVMTNRTPYDECETVLQVAAKTMSGQGPDIMQMVSNPSLREVISACIQPLTCFRPTADELYFHPLFQPKTLPVEVEPNYDNATDRAEVLDRFVRSLGNPETRNPNFNLRLRFRDKKMLQELGLDDGESLEFDLDIYKAEDQDIPDLIHNLRLGYEDKLWRVFENPKQPDKKVVSSHLDKLFSSIRLQMQFLVKVLLGKRWKAILDSLVQDQPVRKKQEGASTVDEDDESDTDAYDTSSFTIIGKYKSKWNRAKKLLEKEIQAYRNSTINVSSASSSNVLCSAVNTIAPTLASSVTSTTSMLPVVASQSNMDTMHNPVSASGVGTSGHVSIVHPSKTISEPVDSYYSNPYSSHQVSSTGHGLTSIGKFTVTVPPSATAAPAIPNVLPSLSLNGPGPTPSPTPIPPQQSVGIQKSSEVPISSCSNSSTLYAAPVSLQTDANLCARRPVSDQKSTIITPSISLQVSTASLAGGSSSQQALNQKPPLPFQSHQSIPSLSTSQTQPSGFVPPPSSLLKSDMDSTHLNNLDTIARSAMILQQVLQGITSTSIANPSVSTTESFLNSQTEGANQNHPVNSVFAPPISSDNQSMIQQSQHSTSMKNQFQSHVGTLNVNDIGTSLQTVTPGLGGIQHSNSALQNENFVQSESDHLQKTDQSSLLVNSEHASLINQLTEVIINNATAQGLLLGGNNYISSMNALYNDAQQSQQPIVNNQAALSNYLSRQSSTPQQQSQLENVTSIVKPTERRTRKKSKSKPRYILRVTKIERDSESCEPGNCRPTFYLEMPDMNNPNNELWKITFRCNLSDTLEDIKLFQGSDYTPVNKDIDRAAKEGVMKLLEALRNDVHSVKLNQDYIFYPQPSTVGFDQINRPPTNLSNAPLFQSSVPPNCNSTNQFSNGGFQNTGTCLPCISTIPYDNSTLISNFEEIQPLDSKDLDDEEEFSENSRPMSPVDNINQPINYLFQPVASNVEPISNPISNIIPQCMMYYVASSAVGLPTSDSIVSNSRIKGDLGQIPENVPASDISNSNFVTQSLLPMNLNYIKDILSLPVGRLENGGVNLFNCQAGLEEVPPLVPRLSEQSGAALAGISRSTSCNESTSRDPVVISQSDDVAYQSYSTHPLRNMTNLNHISACNQGGTGYNSSFSFTPEELVNVTVTIPAYLETTLKNLVSNLCSNPSHACVLIPTLESNEISSFYRCSGVQVVDIPDGHMFVGIPGNRRMPSGTRLHSTLLTTVQANSEKLFVLASGANSDDSFSGPHIYRIPQDSALVLTHTGNIHLLDKAALVVPVRSMDHSHSISPPSSPVHESGTNLVVSSVYVRKLPIPADVDTLSFDDVLALLMALRDAPHGAMQSYPLNMIGTNTDGENVAIGPNTLAFDNNLGPESLSRRSSAATTILPASPNYYSTQVQTVPSSGMNPNQPSLNVTNQQQVQSSLQSEINTASQFPIPVSIGQQSTNQLAGTVNSQLFLPDQIQSLIQSVNQPFSLQSFPYSAVKSGTSYINQSNMSTDNTQSVQSIVAQNQLSLPLKNMFSQQQSFPIKLLQDQILVNNQSQGNPSCLPNLQSQNQQQQPQQSQQQQSVVFPQSHAPAQSTSSQSKESQQQTLVQPNTQQLLQLLSALNTLQNLDQVPQLLSNLLKTSSQFANPVSKSSTGSGAVGTAPSVGVVRHSRQVSPPVSTQSVTLSSTQCQTNHVPQRFNSVAYPSVSNAGVCAASVNSLPDLLGRLLSSAAANSEWLNVSEANKRQGIQIHPTFVQNNLSSCGSTLENQESLNIQSAVKTPTVQGGGIITPQSSQPNQQQQQLIQIPTHQQSTQIQSQLQHSQLVSSQQSSQMQPHVLQQSHATISSTQTQCQQQPPQMSGQIQQLTQLQPSPQPAQIQQQQQQTSQILSQIPSLQIQQQTPTVNPQIQTHQIHQQQASVIPLQQQSSQSQTLQTSQQQSQTHQQSSNQPHITQPITGHQQVQYTSQQWQQPQHSLNVMPKLSSPLPTRDRNQQLSLSNAHSYLSQILPELANAVRLIQQTPDNNSAGFLPLDVQNKLLTLLQQQQQIQNQPPHLSAQELSSNFTGTNTTFPTCVAVPSNTNQVLNVHSASSSSKLPIPSNSNFASLNRFIVTSSNISTPNPICTAVTSCSTRDHVALPVDVTKDIKNVEYSLTSLPTEQPSITSTRPVNPSGTTIANKFTVAPANLEDDDPGPPMIPHMPGPNQLHQAPPPRPPRQHRPYAASVIGVHATNDLPGHASMAVSGTNVSLIPNMNQALPNNGTVTNVNVGLNMNQPLPTGSATNIKSASNVPSINKIENVPLQSGPSIVTFPTTTLTVTLPRTQNLPHHQPKSSVSNMTSTIPSNVVHLSTSVNPASSVTNPIQSGSQISTTK
uniref:Protein kinase domain-containing protein n=1 Tax=Schistosoma mansoni TaxID=6183 RepID=A0A5K4F2J6_SCHMA